MGAEGCSHAPVSCPFALQSDTVDTGEGGAAALPQPQAPEHREAAQVVPSMEGEGQVSPTGWRGGGLGGKSGNQQHSGREKTGKCTRWQMLHPAQRMYFITKITILNGCS